MKTILLYSEEGCPWCDEIKKRLHEKNIRFLVRDVQKYAKEWELVTTLTENEYVPALCMLDHDTKKKTYLVPDKDFEDINEAIEKLQNILT
jgi:glutaredoxin|tara:strand:- start:711 stop:983 length:273 start_codon:yes stop_codon:yes gene_type:complete